MEQWLVDAHRKLDKMPQGAKEIRERALADLPFFAKLVNPTYVYGSMHMEAFRWLQEYSLFGLGHEQSPNKLLMFPRAHLKSHVIATAAAWLIVRHPEITIFYVSATAELAQTQLFAIQNILSGPVFRRYFPEYINPQEGKREKWSSVKISIDHEKRKKEGVRDATVTTAGLTTNTTGWHSDIILADDLVVPENAYTKDGRDSVIKKSSQFTSIRNNGGFTLACGTRYHPSDIYDTWQGQKYEDYDDEGNLLGEKPVWEVMERVVEEDGVFLWPRTIREDGKAFGFDLRTLARIRAEYEDKTQFHAQYYNDPNNAGADLIDRENFQYYNPKFLVRDRGVWKFKGRKLNIYAAVDFAFSMKKAADSTSIVVIGVDHSGDIYVLDIDRFKTDKTLEYFRHIATLHSKWNFKKLRAEVSVAQKVIVNAIKEHIKKEGLSLPIEEYRPNRTEGSKEERIMAALGHRYEDQSIWHTEGGYTNMLEDELVKAKPKHDDLKDALASAVSISVPPKQRTREEVNPLLTVDTRKSRFGGG